MKHCAFVTSFLLLVCLKLLDQPQAVAQNSGHNARFQWSLASAEELNYKETLDTSSKLSKAEKRSLANKIAELVRPFIEDDDIRSDADLTRFIQTARVKLIDLNGDGRPEVLVQPSNYHLGCGATGNCTLWVFQKVIADYKLILDTRDRDGIGGIELITVRQARTNGFRDLVLASHISAGEKSLGVYRFRNDSYRNTKCYLANWEYVDKGKLHSVRYPLITRGCN